MIRAAAGGSWRPGRRGAALGLIALALAALPLALHVSLDNRIELWIDSESAESREYARFREAFGSDEFVLAFLEGADPFDAEALEAQIRAHEALAALPDVVGVSGLASLLHSIPARPDADALLRVLLSSPYYLDFLVTADGRGAAILVETAPLGDAAARRELLGGIRQALRPLEQHGFAVHVVGPPALNVALDEASEREVRRTFPIAVAGSIAVLALLFRSLRTTLVAVSCASLTILLTIELIGLSGRPLNMITSVLPSLLWVLALANAIHILRRYTGHRGGSRTCEEAMARALAETAGPCALASVTTALGFLSLVTATMTPVRELGAFACAGLLISLAVNLLVVPALAVWLRVGGLRSRAPARGTRWLGLGARRPRAVLVPAALLALAALASLGWLRVESDPLAFLPEDAETARAYDAVSRRLTGYYSLELVVETRAGWLEEASWPAIDALAATLADDPGVARVLSPLDWLRNLNQWRHGGSPDHYRLPEGSGAARALVDRLGNGVPGGPVRLVAPDGESVRLSALVRVMDSDRFGAIRRKADGALAALPPPLSGYSTGIVNQLVDAQLDLVHTQLRSFAAAFAIVFVSIGIGLRSGRLMLLSILPNALPILCTFGAMSLLGVPLDAATVMVASVALGIAVDDTVHVLAAYRRARREGAEPGAAIPAALAHVAPAMTITTVTACIGFLALLRSAFVPIFHFGLLAAIAMVVALAADLLLLPALLALAAPGRKAAA